MVMRYVWKMYFLFFIFWMFFQDPVLANIFVTTPVIIEYDRLEISCFPNNNGILFQEISSIEISKNTTEFSFGVIVRLETNNGTEFIDWTDSSIQSRANFSGSISSTRNSRLTLSMTSDQVVCSDDGVYRCTITGSDLSGSAMVEVGEAFVDVQVLPSQLNLTATTSTGSEFTPGSIIQFVCSGLVGDPVLPLYWCIQNGTGQPFVPYFPLDNINQSEPTLLYPCQYRSSSSLTYTVSDTDVTLLCGVGNEASCNSTNTLNSSYTVKITTKTTTDLADATTTPEAEIPSFPNIDLTTPVYLRETDLMVTCYPENNGILFKDVYSITLSKETTESSYSPVVTVYYDRNLGTVIQWFDTSMEQRANVSADISSPRNSRLEMLISRDRVLCSDEGGYKCSISGIDILGVVKEENGQAYLDVKANPEKPEVTASSVEYGTSDTIGIFPPSTVLNLTCTGILGDPPKQIYWCLKNGSLQSEFIPYINQSEPVFEAPCVYRAFSTLIYTVNENDLDLVFICAVGDGFSCGDDMVNDTYTVIAGNPVEPKADIETKTPVLEGYDYFYITCNPSDNGDAFRNIDRILLSVNRFGNIGFTYIPRVEVQFNRTSGSSQLYWYSTSLENRANVLADVSTPAVSHLSLSINASLVECDDKGRYRCGITGTSMKGDIITVENSSLVELQTMPKQVHLNVTGTLIAESEIAAVVSPGTLINFTCSGIVGDPPQNITWCLRNSTEEPYLPYPRADDISQSPPMVQSCQFSLTSTLSYTVNKDDFDLSFLCEVGSTSGCGSGLVQDTYTIYAGDQVEPLVDVYALSPVVIDVDNLVLSCTQSIFGGKFKDIKSFLISLNPFGDIGFTFVPKVEVRINKTSGIQEIVWHSSTLESRATLDILTGTNGLVLNISSPLCEDQGRYKCEVTGTTVIDTDVVIENSTLIDIQSNPEKPEVTASSVEYGLSDTIGVFPPSTVLNLTCAGIIGDPPQQLYWCLKNGSVQAESIPNINQSEPVFVAPCVYRAFSTLVYTVNENDLDLVFICAVGDGFSCGDNNVNDTYTVIAGNPVEPKADIETKSPVLEGYDDFYITCNPSDNGDAFRNIDRILLSVNRFGNIGFTYIPRVEVQFNRTSGSSQLYWYSTSLENRANVLADVSTPDESHLRLFINASLVECDDKGRYRCEIMGTNMKGDIITVENSSLVELQTLPKEVHLNVTGKLVAESETAAVVSPGEIINFTCSGIVGDPPQNITWCFRNNTDGQYLPYQRADNINQSPPMVQSCQFSLSSTLSYTVNKDDFDLSFLCKVGSTSGCGSGLVQDTYTIYAGDQVEPRVDVYASSPVVVGVDNLEVSCTQSTVGGKFKDITGYLISLNPFGDIGFTFVPKVEVRINKTSGTQEIVWHSSTLESRATLAILTETNGLVLNISSPLCEDQGKYKCEVAGTTVIDTNVVIGNSTLIDVQSLPEQVHLNVTGPLIAQSEMAAVVIPGVVINITCSGIVGDPPQNITWCFRNSTDKPYLRYPQADDINQSPPMVQSCQFSLTSTLLYTVNKDDFDLSFLCEVGSTSGCGSGLVQDTYTIYAGDQVEPRVDVFASSPVIIGDDNLVVSCTQSSLGGRFKDVTGYLISVNPFGDIGFTFLPRVEVRINTTTGSKEIIWHSSTLESRATLLTLTEQSGLLLNISDPLCDDQGRYRCEVTGSTLLDTNVIVENSTLIDIQSLPNGIDPIMIESSASGTVNIFPVGTNLNLTCSAGVGDPPRSIRWCVRNMSDSDWQQLTVGVVQSNPVQTDPCFYNRSSILSYELVSETEFLCEVGGGTTCESGFRKEYLNIYARTSTPDSVSSSVSTTTGTTMSLTQGVTSGTNNSIQTQTTTKTPSWGVDMYSSATPSGYSLQLLIIFLIIGTGIPAYIATFTQAS